MFKIFEKKLNTQGSTAKNSNRKNSCPKTTNNSLHSPAYEFSMNNTITTQSPINKYKESFISNNSKITEINKNNNINKPLTSSSTIIMEKKKRDRYSQIKNHIKSMKQKEEECDKFCKMVKNLNTKKTIIKKIKEENNNDLAKAIKEKQKELKKNKRLVKERREKYRNSMDKRKIEKKLKLTKINQENKINKQMNRLVLHEYNESVINTNKAKCSKIAQQYNEYKLKKKQKEFENNKSRNTHKECKKKFSKNLSELEMIENEYAEKLRKKMKMKEEMKKEMYYSGSNSGNNSGNNSEIKYLNIFNYLGVISTEKEEYNNNNVSHFLCECKNLKKCKNGNFHQSSFSTFSSLEIDK